MKRSILLILVLFVAGWGMFSSRVILQEFRVDAENNDLIVKWQAQVEEDVSHYLIKRLTRLDYDFIEIAEVAAQGSNKLYLYRDNEIYKTAVETVEYELVAVGSDGSLTSFGKRQVAYTPTAVRRTWGSIKAMFQ